MVKVTYIPNKFEDTKLEKEIPFDAENPWLLVHVTAFADLNVDYRHAICKDRITLYVNDKEVQVDEWNSYEVKDKDLIVITPAIEGGRGGVLNAVIGAVLTVVGVALAAYTGGSSLSLSSIGAGLAASKVLTAMVMIGASMLLGGVIQMLFGAGRSGSNLHPARVPSVQRRRPGRMRLGVGWRPGRGYSDCSGRRCHGWQQT